MAEKEPFIVRFEKRGKLLNLPVKVKNSNQDAVAMALGMPRHRHVRNFIFDIERGIANAVLEDYESVWLKHDDIMELSQLVPDSNVISLIARHFRLKGFRAYSGFWAHENLCFCISWVYNVSTDCYDERLKNPLV